jgi:hypothetical protein
MSKKDLGNVKIQALLLINFINIIVISESKGCKDKVQHQRFAQDCKLTFYWNFSGIGNGTLHDLFQASSQ